MLLAFPCFTRLDDQIDIRCDRVTCENKGVPGEDCTEQQNLVIPTLSHHPLFALTEFYIEQNGSLVW